MKTDARMKFEKINEETLLNAVKHFKNSRAEGPDKISIIVIKKCFNHLKDSVRLINQ